MDDGFQDDEEFSAASGSRSVAVVGGRGQEFTGRGHVCQAGLQPADSRQIAFA